MSEAPLNYNGLQDIFRSSLHRDYCYEVFLQVYRGVCQERMWCNMCGWCGGTNFYVVLRLSHSPPKYSRRAQMDNVPQRTLLFHPLS